MTTSPTVRCGHTLIVFEGAPRVTWRRARPSSWRPTGLWPTETEAAAVRDRLERGGGVLVLFEKGTPEVAMLAEEFACAPAGIKALAIQGAEPETVTLRIPLLSWLPANLRDRGLDFHRRASDLATKLPHALLPPLLLEPQDSDVPHLRFGLQVWPCSPVALAAAARHTFATPSTDRPGDDPTFAEKNSREEGES
jgi:hypothetical protein